MARQFSPQSSNTKLKNNYLNQKHPVCHFNIIMGCRTWSGRRPGGTHVYSSKAHPESSSDCECLCGSVGCPYWTPLPRSLSVGSRPTATPGALPPPPPDDGGRDGGGPAPWPRGLPVAAIPPLCSSRGHLQFRQTFLQRRNKFLSYTCQYNLLKAKLV